MSPGADIVESSKSLFIVLPLAHMLNDSTLQTYLAELITDNALVHILCIHYKLHERIN